MVLLKKLLAMVRSTPTVHIFIILLVLISGILRLWKLDGSSQFLGDQGRDALIVANIFRHGDIVAIGPTTSVGNIYLGPLYYYFMLPFLFLSYPSPMGPIYAVAVLGTITVFFLYYWGRKIIGETGAVSAAILCAFSVVAINFSRFSWNPNPMPFVSLALLLFTYLAVTKHPKFWLGVGVTFAVLLQLHYVTLLAGAAAGVIWIWQLIQVVRQKKTWKPLVGYALGAVAVVLLSLLPLILFDLKHGGLNMQALQKMFTSTENFTTTPAESTSSIAVLRETHGRSMHILFEFLIGKNRVLNSMLVLLTLVTTALYFLKRKNSPYRTGMAIITTFLVMGILGFSFYQHTVFDHYIAFLFPVTFLFLGFYLGELWKWNMVGKLLVIASLVFFLGFNIPQYSFKPSSATFELLTQVSNTIHQRVSPGQPYGVVLVSATKDYLGMNYRYFLSTNQEKEPLPSSEHDSAELLFIINEDKATNTPEEIDIFEITTFSDPYVSERYTVPGGPDITVLRKGSESVQN